MLIGAIFKFISESYELKSPPVMSLYYVNINSMHKMNWIIIFKIFYAYHMHIYYNNSYQISEVPRANNWLSARHEIKNRVFKLSNFSIIIYPFTFIIIFNDHFENYLSMAKRLWFLSVRLKLRINQNFFTAYSREWDGGHLI